jgi:hypothetical protein
VRVVGDFMERPTDVLRSYMAAQGIDAEEAERLLRMGRIAMALEVMTVVKMLEEFQLLSENERMISVLITLLTDQDLLGVATAYYEDLSEWRRIKAVEVDAAAHDVQLSAHAAPPDDVVPHGSNVVQLRTGRTKDPPSSD